MTGVKDDGLTPGRGEMKARWDQLPMGPVGEAVLVLTHGAAKYGDRNWESVPDGVNRYYAALMRHITAWRCGEGVDESTGQSHLAHALCCIVFIRELERRAGA